MMTLFRILGGFTSIYMLACFARVMLTWVDASSLGRPYELLRKGTDPYLDWFRRFPALRTPSFDFSPVAALAALALANDVFNAIGHFGRISLGIFLSMVVSSVWSAASFIMFFFTIVIAVRLASLLIGRQTTHTIWNILDSISSPVLYRISRLFYGDRLVSYQRGMGTAIAALVGLQLGGGLLVRIVSGLLSRLPI